MPKPLKLFSDFDGTITRLDACDLIVDHCIGRRARQAIDDRIVAGQLTFRQGYTAQFAGVTLTWDEARRRLRRHNALDPTFAPFVRWTEEAGIPLVILSSGLEQIIREYLMPANLNHLEVRANRIQVQGRRWQITFWDDTPFGHDKAAALREAKAQGFRVAYIGDGISDIHAAAAADLLFAKRGARLLALCAERNIPCRPFSNFNEVRAAIVSE
ncbi:MAG: MtnX-like HAD-IB family phosphatase [Anaerolineae bacterium]